MAEKQTKNNTTQLLTIDKKKEPAGLPTCQSTPMTHKRKTIEASKAFHRKGIQKQIKESIINQHGHLPITSRTPIKAISSSHTLSREEKSRRIDTTEPTQQLKHQTILQKLNNIQQEVPEHIRKEILKKK